MEQKRPKFKLKSISPEKIKFYDSSLAESRVTREADESAFRALNPINTKGLADFFFNHIFGYEIEEIFQQHGTELTLDEIKKYLRGNPNSKWVIHEFDTKVNIPAGVMERRVQEAKESFMAMHSNKKEEFN